MHNVQDKMGLNEYDPERLLFQLTCVEEVSELIISLVAMFEDVPTITLDGKLFFRKRQPVISLFDMFEVCWSKWLQN